jgi:hypothetical protein
MNNKDKIEKQLEAIQQCKRSRSIGIGRKDLYFYPDIEDYLELTGYWLEDWPELMPDYGEMYEMFKKMEHLTYDLHGKMYPLIFYVLAKKETATSLDITRLKLTIEYYDIIKNELEPLADAFLARIRQIAPVKIANDLEPYWGNKKNPWHKGVDSRENPLLYDLSWYYCDGNLYKLLLQDYYEIIQLLKIKYADELQLLPGK